MSTAVEEYTDWFYSVGVKEAKRRFGLEPFSFVALDPSRMFDWRKPLSTALVILSSEQPTDLEDGGTVENIGRKLMGRLFHFLQTGNDQPEFDIPVHLLLRGSFPYKGAGCHGGIWGGVSGYPSGATDWRAYVYLVDPLFRFLANDNAPLLELVDSRKNPERTVQQKYMLPPGAPVGVSTLGYVPPGNSALGQELDHLGLFPGQVS